jgi:NADPH:quinone reductase
MRAVGYHQSRPIDAPEALIDVELPDPVATGRDLLVEVRAVSVNPVDTKVRRRTGPDEPGPATRCSTRAASPARVPTPSCT